MGPGTPQPWQEPGGGLRGLKGGVCRVAQRLLQAKAGLQVALQPGLEGLERIEHGLVAHGRLAQITDRLEGCAHSGDDWLLVVLLRRLGYNLAGCQKAATPQGAGGAAAMVRPGFAGLHQRLAGAPAADQGAGHCRLGPLNATQHAQAVVAIARHGSFSRAGEAIGLTQSAVSHSVKELEAEIGVRLLDRLVAEHYEDK